MAKEPNQWKEVELEEAAYGIVLRPNSTDTSAYFYKTLEDLQWAMENSWFDSREAFPFKLLKKEIVITEI